MGKFGRRIARATQDRVLCSSFALLVASAGAHAQVYIPPRQLPSSAPETPPNPPQPAPTSDAPVQGSPPLDQDTHGTYYPGTTASESRAGHGEVSLTYQYGYSNGGTVFGSHYAPIGRIDAHSLFLNIDYSVTDRLSVSAGIPYFVARYLGPIPHDIHQVDPDAGELDDGRFHGDFQDVLLEARYLVLDEDWKIEPYTLITIPSHDYPTFSHAAVGQHLFKVELGSTIYYVPPFDDWYVTAWGGRVFVEHPLGHSVDHWKLSLEPGYYLSPDFAVHALLLVKQGDGLSIPGDFPDPNSELFFEHDRLVRNNYVDVGVGFDWLLPGGRRLSFAALKMIEYEDTHIMKFGMQIALAQSF